MNYQGCFQYGKIREGTTKNWEQESPFSESLTTHNAHGCLPARTPGHIRRVWWWPGHTFIPTWGVVIVKQGPVSDVLDFLLIGKLEEKLVIGSLKGPWVVQLPYHCTIFSEMNFSGFQSTNRGCNGLKPLDLFLWILFPKLASIHQSIHPSILKMAYSGSNLYIQMTGDTRVTKKVFS